MTHCGLDFGTSNSVIYISNTTQSTPLFLLSEPTVLFFPEDQTRFKDVYVGKEAIETYLASGMNGRFFQSIKSLLSDPSYTGTEVGVIFYTLVDLLELVMRHLKQAAEAQVGPITSVTIGRPVIFSENPDHDFLAQDRLFKAAKRAGFTAISFQLEPIAAALAYETRLQQPETVLVADFGGGTTDYTVMHLHPQAHGDRKKDMLATGGVYIGGDTFDARIMWHQLTPHFGYGSHYKDWNKVYDLPLHFFHVICAWADISRLKTPTYQAQLKEILWGSDNKPAIERLITLINHDLGFALFKAIEAAKQTVSTASKGWITFNNRNIAIHDTLTLGQFSSYIHEDCLKIQDALTETLAQAKLSETAIDTVFLTGGSSLVRHIRTDFETRFGNQKLNEDLDLFTSVAQGLACRGGFEHIEKA